MCLSYQIPLTLENISEQLWLLLKLWWNKSTMSHSVRSHPVHFYTLSLFFWIFNNIFRGTHWKRLGFYMEPTFVSSLILTIFFKGRRRLNLCSYGMQLITNSLIAIKERVSVSAFSSTFNLFFLCEYGIPLPYFFNIKGEEKMSCSTGDGFCSREFGRSAEDRDCSLFLLSYFLNTF